METPDSGCSLTWSWSVTAALSSEAREYVVTVSRGAGYAANAILAISLDTYGGQSNSINCQTAGSRVNTKSLHSLAIHTNL